MCTGGRIMHHLKFNLPNPATTVLIVGFHVVIEFVRWRAVGQLTTPCRGAVSLTS